MSKHIFFLLTFILILQIEEINAQQPLSLSDAIALGLENNYQIRIADQSVLIARNNNSWGMAGRWPRLSVGMNGSWFRSGSPTAFSPERLTASMGPDLNWTLFDGFRVVATKARLDLLQEQSAGNASIVVETNIQAIVLSYYNALLAKEQVKVLEEVLSASKTRLDYESFRKEMGASGTFELLQFKDAVLNDSANLMLQQLSLKNAYKNLNRVMGAPIDVEYYLSEALQTEFNEYDLEDLRVKMMNSNNNLKNQYITNQILRQDIRIAKAAMYPTLAANAGLNYSFGQAQVRNRDPNTLESMPFVTQRFNANDYSAGFSISFNLFNGGIVKRALQTAKINELVGELQEDDLEQQLTLDLMIAYDNYQLRLDILNVRLASIENAETNMNLAEERFKSGLINSLDYRQIQLQYLNSRFTYLQALRDLKDSETELIRLTGGLVRVDGN